MAAAVVSGDRAGAWRRLCPWPLFPHVAWSSSSVELSLPRINRSTNVRRRETLLLLNISVFDCCVHDTTSSLLPATYYTTDARASHRPMPAEISRAFLARRSFPGCHADAYGMNLADPSLAISVIPVIWLSHPSSSRAHVGTT